MHRRRTIIRGFWLAALLAGAATAPSRAQDLPQISPEAAAAAIAAVDAADLSDNVYRSLWCAGSYSLVNARQEAAAEPGAAAASAAARDRLYRQAARELLAAGLAEQEFTEIAEAVYRVALAQEQSSVAANRDFTEADCVAAAATAD